MGQFAGGLVNTFVAFIFERESCYLAQAGPEPQAVLLTSSVKGHNYRHVLLYLHWLFFSFGVKPLFKQMTGFG